MDNEQIIKEVTAEVKESLRKEQAEKEAEQERLDANNPFLQKLKKYK